MKPIKIAVLFSGSASSLQYLFETDLNYGRTYEIVCAISNKKDTKGEKFCIENNIPFVELNTKKICEQNGYFGKLRDMPQTIRVRYFIELLKILKKQFKPDLVLLSGFMLEITEPLLWYVPIINVHPADMRIKNNDGKPKYIGDNAVVDAIQACEKYTASTIHVVQKELDCGEIICVSEPLFVEASTDPKEHQEKMKKLCDGPAYQRALELITSGTFLFASDFVL